MVFIPMAVCLAASLENAFYQYLNFSSPVFFHAGCGEGRGQESPAPGCHRGLLPPSCAGCGAGAHPTVSVSAYCDRALRYNGNRAHSCMGQVPGAMLVGQCKGKSQAWGVLQLQFPSPPPEKLWCEAAWC